MASATPAAYFRGQNIQASDKYGIRGLRSSSSVAESGRRGDRSPLFGLAVGIYDVYTSQTSGIHGVRESKLCIQNLCTNVKTDHWGEGIA